MFTVDKASNIPSISVDAWLDIGGGKSVEEKDFQMVAFFLEKAFREGYQYDRNNGFKKLSDVKVQVINKPEILSKLFPETVLKIDKSYDDGEIETKYLAPTRIGRDSHYFWAFSEINLDDQNFYVRNQY